MMHLRRYLLPVLFLVALLPKWPAGAQAQAPPFAHRAEVGPASQSGFHRILLPPAVMARLNPRQADLRLYDAEGREVPYFVTREEGVQRQDAFREYEVVQHETTGRHTRLVLHNPGGGPINNISLMIKNANVRKQAQLSGSNDARNWYVIEAQLLLTAPTSRAATAELQPLTFPLSDYAYYQLDINDSTSAPLNILRAGYYATTTQPGHYLPVPEVAVRRQDSAALKSTYFFFTATHHPVVDKLELPITGPAHFLRPAALYALRTETDRRQKEVTVWEQVQQVQLRSGKENTLLLPALRARRFVLVIENGDSPPLQLQAPRLLQRRTTLTADLQAGQTYHLLFGHPQASVPSYDLAYFQENVPATVPVLTPGEILPNPAVSAPPAPEPGALAKLFSSELVIWAAMLLVIGFLGVMTFQMLQEKKQ